MLLQVFLLFSLHAVAFGKPLANDCKDLETSRRQCCQQAQPYTQYQQCCQHPSYNCQQPQPQPCCPQPPPATTLDRPLFANPKPTPTRRPSTIPTSAPKTVTATKSTNGNVVRVTTLSPFSTPTTTGAPKAITTAKPTNGDVNKITTLSPCSTPITTGAPKAITTSNPTNGDVNRVTTLSPCSTPTATGANTTNADIMKITTLSPVSTSTDEGLLRITTLAPTLSSTNLMTNTGSIADANLTRITTLAPGLTSTTLVSPFTTLSTITTPNPLYQDSGSGTLLDSSLSDFNSPTSSTLNVTSITTRRRITEDHFAYSLPTPRTTSTLTYKFDDDDDDDDESDDAKNEMDGFDDQLSGTDDKTDDQKTYGQVDKSLLFSKQSNSFRSKGACIYENNTAYNMELFGRKYFTRTWMGCSRICFENKNCEAWTWNSPDYPETGRQRECRLGKNFMQEQKKKDEEKTDEDGKMSGMKSCGNTEYCKMQYNKASRDKTAEIRRKRTDTAEECSEACYEESRCEAWEFSEKMCSLLKRGLKELSPKIGSKDSLLGSKTCGMNHPCKVGEGISYNGDRIRLARGLVNIKRCMWRCLKNSNCDVWEWQPVKNGNNVCTLKSIQNDDGAVGDESKISGTKQCAAYLPNGHTMLY